MTPVPEEAVEPEVSVVIATRNRWSFLSTHGLRSALAQEDVETEVIVVDDCSTDETPERLAELHDPRVRVLRLDVRRKLPGAHNVGLGAARGEWVAFLDDDDLWAPRKLRVQLDALNETGADWAYGRAVVVDARHRVLELHPFPAPDEVHDLLHEGNFVPGGGSNVVARTNLVRRVGGFDESLIRFSDWDLWLRLAATGPPAVCPEVLVARVEHGDNMVIRDRKHAMTSFSHLMGKYREVTRQDRLGVAQWAAHEHHLAGRRLVAAWLYLRAALVYRSPGNLPPALGALFGRSGMRLASRLLLAMRGSSHIEPEPKTSVPTPEWLSRDP